MVSTITRFNLEKDVDSKELIPVFLYATEIGKIELGEFVKWVRHLKNTGKRPARLEDL